MLWVFRDKYPTWRVDSTPESALGFLALSIYFDSNIYQYLNVYSNMDAKKMADTFKMLASPHRVNIMRFLHNKGKSGFVDMMEGMGLDPKVDCGNFGYHLSELGKAGVVRRNKKGLYTITPVGEKIWSSMHQLVEEVEDTMDQGEQTVSISEFGEQDVHGTYARIGDG